MNQEQIKANKLKEMCALRDEMSKGGKRSCPHCKSRSWWQTARQGRQCNKCHKLF